MSKNNRKSNSAAANPSREIRAVYDDATIRVYQAYNDAIADAAVAGQSFRAPLEAGLWSATRMTWIKPSKVWMAYRCGFTLLKDKNQRRVLALDIAREEVEKMLERAQVNHIHGKNSNNNTNDGKNNKEKIKKHRDGHVVVQWDPERVLSTKVGTKPKDAFTSSIAATRSIQIGLKGNASKMLLDPKVVIKITDVTQDFRGALEALQRKDIDAAKALLWPGHQTEELLEVPDHIKESLGMKK